MNKIPMKRREQLDTLQTHWLVPVSLNGQGPFLFALDTSRSRTLVSARTLEAVGFTVDWRDESDSSVSISDKLLYPTLRLQSIAIGDAVVSNFDVVAWGSPVIPKKILEEMREDAMYPLGELPITAIESVLECRGVIGIDYLSRFRVSLDFAAETVSFE